MTALRTTKTFLQFLPTSLPIVHHSHSTVHLHRLDPDPILWTGAPIEQIRRLGALSRSPRPSFVPSTSNGYTFVSCCCHKTVFSIGTATKWKHLATPSITPRARLEWVVSPPYHSALPHPSTSLPLFFANFQLGYEQSLLWP